MLRRFLIAMIVLAIHAVPGFAARVKVWHQHSPGQYEKAQFDHLTQTSEGPLKLAHQLRPLASLDATHVWAVVEDAVGNLIVGTGDAGKIFKVNPEGKVSLLHTAKSSQVLCLAQGKDGSVYAGTGPGGQIIRIDPQGKASVWCETKAGYIWSLAIDPDSGTVYAGTGPHGRILQVTPEGVCSVFYQTRQEHVLCVATGPKGSVYAGTDKNGLVYRIDSKGKGFVLHQAAQSEVRSLKVTPNGLYVGTSAPGKGKGGSSSVGISPLSSVSTNADTSETPVSAGKSDKPEATRISDKSESSATKDMPSSHSSPASAPSTPSSGENSVYRIAADGTVRELFREKTLVLSLLQKNTQFLVGTGMDGQLFEVDEATQERSEVARLDHGQILCLCQRKDGSVVLGTGDPGKLYVLQDAYHHTGSVVSEVLDAKLTSRWGALSWQANTPEGTKVTVAVRSGNVSEPDDTWSDWSEEQTDPKETTMTIPSARFLQYRITMHADKDSHITPSVRGVFLRYMTTNLAPEVTKIEVPDLNAVNLDNPKKLKIKWSAVDPNEDELSYSIWVRKEGWSDWVKLEEDLEKTDYEWDTTTTPSGVYQVKIVASDRKDNAESEALHAHKVSVPFVVCHTAPTVELKVTSIDGDRAVIEAQAVSPLVRLTSASYAVNGKKWNSAFPKDGLFDAKSKTFRIKTDSLQPGTYVLVLQVRDASGNLGTSDVVFTVGSRK